MRSEGSQCRRDSHVVTAGIRVDERPVAVRDGDLLGIDLSAFIDRLAQRIIERLEDVAPTASPWLDIAGAAEYLSCSPERIRKLISRLEIPYHQAGRGARIFLNRHELDEWLTNQ